MHPCPTNKRVSLYTLPIVHLYIHDFNWEEQPPRPVFPSLGREDAQLELHVQHDDGRGEGHTLYSFFLSELTIFYFQSLRLMEQLDCEEEERKKKIGTVQAFQFPNMYRHTILIYWHSEIYTIQIFW